MKDRMIQNGIEYERRAAFREHVERRLRYFPDSLTADKAAEIIGYAPHTVLSYIRQKRIFAVQIGGKLYPPQVRSRGLSHR